MRETDAFKGCIELMTMVYICIWGYEEADKCISQMST